MVPPSSSSASATDHRAATGSDNPRPSDGEQAAAPPALTGQDGTGSRNADDVSSGPDQTGSHDGDDELPFPPRYRWLKRIMLAAVLSILFLLAIRLAWGWYAHRAFERAIAEIRQRGEPIEPEDFDGPDIPDEENAALVYQDANQRLQLTQEESLFVDSAFVRTYWPMASIGWNEADQNAVLQLENKYSKPLQMIRAARSLRDANWNVKYRSPVEEIFFWPEDFRQAIRLLLMLATAASHREEHAKAGSYIGDAIAYAEHFDKEPSLITHLVAIGAIDLACKIAQDALPRVPRFGQPGCQAVNRDTCGPREEWMAIQRQLLDETDFAESGPLRIQFERMFYADGIRCVSNGQFKWSFRWQSWKSKPQASWERLCMWPISPLFLADGRRMIRSYDQFVSALGEDDWPAAHSTLLMSPEHLTAWRRLASPFSAAVDDVSAFLQRFMLVHYKGLAFRRMAATAIAIRMFQEDHGRRPESLEELVPNYLPTVPLDSMAKGDTPIKYLPNASPPILYSVNENGVDDGGWYLDSKGKYSSPAVADLPFFLDGLPTDLDPEND